MAKIRAYEEMEWTTGDFFKFEQHDFNWFMDKMAGGRDSNYKGCQVLIPETVLFKDGKAEKVIRIDDEGCLKQIKGPMDRDQVQKHLE